MIILGDEREVSYTSFACWAFSGRNYEFLHSRRRWRVDICHFIHVISATLHFTPKTIKCEDLSLLGCYLYRLVNGSPTRERTVVPLSAWSSRPRTA